MDEMRVNAYMTANSRHFNPSALPTVRSVLTNMPDDAIYNLEAVDFKDPTTVLILSLFLGSLGVDRFVLGDVGLGLLKLFTAGGCGLWTIIDWFTAQNRTRSTNYKRFMEAVAGSSQEGNQIVYNADPTPETDDVAESSFEAKIANTFNSNVAQNDANAENSVPTDEPVEVYESEPAENASNDEIPLE